MCCSLFRPVVAACAVWSAVVAAAADLKVVGNWKITFEEPEARLSLANGARRLRLDGTLAFSSEGKAWKVVLPRDAAADRLSLVNPAGTVLGYVSFHGAGDRLEMELYHRAGANFFPGQLVFAGTTAFRRESFACRTFPARGEQVLNFADGAGDSTCNDSLFAREEDLALRFRSDATRLTASGAPGTYAFSLAADIDDPARATMLVEADAAYYASRWAPGYHPIDRRRCPKAPTGWMSWNVYFDKAGSAENLAEAVIGAKYLKPFGLDIWSIESWQGNSLWLPVGKFHNLDLSRYEPQFPETMKELADKIRKLGFRPGLWMPLYGTGDKAFHDAHPTWFLHDEKGQPINNWNGVYMLDTTNEEALDHIRKICRIASR
ncbi:MAG: alpha-galactosidase, partial [Kiritimatiellae bacterium]|nr:alpha-galactosidase [Kiritimatiellia bacterium]